MIVTTSNKTLPDRRNRQIRINQPLLASMTTPRGGWSVSFIINKNKIVVNGSSANQVFSNTSKLMLRNNIDISTDNIWFSLNYQWMEKVPEESMLVHPSIIRGAVMSSDGNEVPQEYHHPSTWGRIEWDAMANYLNIDEPNYSYNEFLARVESTLNLLNPTKASRIGCIDCFKEFSSFVANLRTNPIYKLEDAKQWLFNTHNKVNNKIGKEVISYEKAKQLNRWT